MVRKPIRKPIIKPIRAGQREGDKRFLEGLVKRAIDGVLQHTVMPRFSVLSYL